MAHGTYVAYRTFGTHGTSETNLLKFFVA